MCLVSIYYSSSFYVAISRASISVASLNVIKTFSRVIATDHERERKEIWKRKKEKNDNFQTTRKTPYCSFWTTMRLTCIRIFRLRHGTSSVSSYIIAFERYDISLNCISKRDVFWRVASAFIWAKILSIQLHRTIVKINFLKEISFIFAVHR